VEEAPMTDPVPPPEQPTTEQLRRAVEALGGFLWMGKNLHNSGTETFRELYGHAMVDARAIYNELDALLDAVATDTPEAQR
jgi:hypothetical protein